MTSLNKTALIGHLGADPAIRFMPDGTPTASVQIATKDVWKDKASGEKKEKTEWHRVVFFSGLAEVARDYLKKGTQIYVEGKLRTRKFVDNEGITKYVTEVIARELKMLGKKIDNELKSAPTETLPPDDGDIDENDVPF